MYSFEKCILIIYVFIIIYVTFYAIAKERQELGCKRSLSSIEKQCIEDESVYLHGTKPEENDSRDVLVKKMDSILSYHEKGAVWRRCWIIMIIIFVFVVVSEIGNCDLNIQRAIYLQLCIFFVLYFFFNYINYHHFRRLKNNGNAIMDILSRNYRL